MQTDIDYEALFRQCAAVMGWEHLADNPVIAPQIPKMIREQYHALQDQAYRNGSDIVSLATVLEAECTEPGNHNRLFAVMMDRVLQLKARSVQPVERNEP